MMSDAVAAADRYAPSDWVDDPDSDAYLVEIAEASERGEFAAEIADAVERLEAALPDGQRIAGPPWRIVGP